MGGLGMAFPVARTRVLLQVSCGKARDDRVRTRQMLIWSCWEPRKQMEDIHARDSDLEIDCVKCTWPFGVRVSCLRVIIVSVNAN